MAVETKAFYEAENQCEYNYRELVEQNGPLWHVCTPGHLSEILNITPDDYRFAVSNSAISAAEARVTVITDAQMSTHIHSLLACPKDSCAVYLDCYKYRLSKHLKSVGRDVDLSRFRCDNPIEINSLDMARNEIVYINRNGFLGNSEYLPYSYPWGGGSLYYNNYAKNQAGIPFADIPLKCKRALLCRRVSELPETYKFANGMILPGSYVAVKAGESLFRGAHHYFQILTKNIEAFSETAKRIGDTVVLSREEMYYAAKMLSSRDFSVNQPSLLAPSDKVKLARTMYFDYHATNSQIQSILKLPIEQVRELFPQNR